MRKRKMDSDPAMSDNLPVGVNDVPKQLYVNSDINTRKLEDVKLKMVLNKFKHKEFDTFYHSKEGKKYLLGISYYDKS